MYKATPNDVRLMEYILVWQAAKKAVTGPTLQEIADFFRLSHRSSALIRVRELETKGFVKRGDKPVYYIQVTTKGKRAIASYDRELKALSLELRDD